jgi:hypothetical protein
MIPMIEIFRKQHVAAREWTQISEGTTRFCQTSIPVSWRWVTEKIKYIGNCLLLNLKGISVSDRMRWVCSIRTVSKINPAITWASTMCLCKCIIVNFVPLKRSYDGIWFHGSMMATPTFSFSLWGGIPLDIIVGRHFVSHVKYLSVIIDKRITWRMHTEMTEAKTFRTFIRIYSIFKCESLSTNIKLILHKALIR